LIHGELLIQGIEWLKIIMEDDGGKKGSEKRWVVS